MSKNSQICCGKLRDSNEDTASGEILFAIIVASGVESSVVKMNVCEYYNIIVDVPTTHLQLVNLDKTSHSNVNCNDKVKAVLIRSFFDSIVKMLELNTDNKVIFVVERLNSDNLKFEFDNMKSVFLLNLISLIL